MSSMPSPTRASGWNDQLATPLTDSSAPTVGDTMRPPVVRETPLRTTLRILRRWPIVPIILVSLMLIAAVFAELLTPYDPTRDDLLERNTPPFWQEGGTTEHILGTDPLGRDILTRIIFGARISLLIAGIVLTVGTAFGLVIGLVSGYAGGTVDEILMRVVDFTFAVPFILVALVTVIVFGQSFALVIILLTIFSWSNVARQTRGETLSLKTREYVDYARVAGASTGRILFRHIAPGLINTVIVVTTLSLGGLILTEASLSFLGVGIPPPTPAWGVMVAEGRNYIYTDWWVSFFPGIAIMLTVMAFNFLGDWFRDRYDPRLRQLG